MELEVLKKSWQSPKLECKKYSKKHLSSFYHKKSTSISKSVTNRLFVFSAVEFIFWGFGGILFQLYFKQYEPHSFTEFKPLVFIEKFNYLALLGFVTYFFMAYKSIKAYSPTKKIMSSILNAKKVITHYIYYNIAIFILTFLIGFTWELFNNDEISSILQEKGEFIYITIIVFVTALMFALTLLLYRMYKYVYGKFINSFDRLYVNFDELTKKDLS